MSKGDGFAPGRVFVVPMLGGGYAFGYATALRGASMFCNVFDHVSDADSPPPGIESLPIAIYDLQVGAEFTIANPSKGGERWRWSEVRVPGPVAPRNRYVQMGLPPRRIDVLGEEPDRPLTAEEAEHVPHLASRFPPHSAAVIEVALKRLDGTPKDLINAWRERSPAKAANAGEATTKKTRRSAEPNAVHVELRLRGKALPTPAEIELRHRLEARIVSEKVGSIVASGAGLGLMEVTVQTDAPEAVERIRSMLHELGVPKTRAKVVAISR